LLSIGSVSCSQGESRNGYIKVAELAYGGEVRVPVTVIRGAQEGPVLWINAAVHGEEVSGIFAILKLIKSINSSDLKGTIIATPVCNPLALKGMQKFTPEDQLDMDQQFPGREGGWLSEQMAYHFFREVKKHASYMVDLHALGSSYAAVPYTVYKNLSGVAAETLVKTEEMALLMGLKANCRVDLSTAKGELPGSLRGALDVQCLLNNIPAIMVELGAGGRVEWENVNRAVNGLQNILRYLRMLDGEPRRPSGQMIITERAFLNTRRGGLAVPEVQPGDEIAGNTPIARVLDFYGEERECLVSPGKAYVLGLRINPVVNSGEIIVGLGLKWEEVK